MTNLRAMRDAAGLSQSQLASASGVSIRMIAKYETGDRDINKAQAFTIYLLARELGCKMEDLIEQDIVEEV